MTRTAAAVVFHGAVYIDLLRVFGVSTDGIGNVVFTQDDYNDLVSQGLVAAGAGVLILTQPELYPVIGTAIVVVAAE